MRQRQHTEIFVFVYLLLFQLASLSAGQKENIVCSLDGFCESESGPNGQSRAEDVSRATECPASDCDGTGILEHHLEGGDGRSVSCGTPFTLSNGFIRCFASDLCTTDRLVDSVTFRVDFFQIDNAAASYDLSVNLYKSATRSCSDVPTFHAQVSPSFTATTTLTHGVGENITDVIVEVDIDPPFEFSSSETLLVEIFAPTLQDVGRFFLGDSNDGNQCDPSYLYGDCPSTQPAVNVANLPAEFGDFSRVSWEVSVNTSPVPVPVPPTDSPTPPPPTPSSAPTLDPIVDSCFVSVVAALGCLFDYLFGWLLPF